MTMDKTALRYLAGLLEQRTGQQIGPNRLWRVETVLKSLMRERGIANLDALVDLLRTGRDMTLSVDVVFASSESSVTLTGYAPSAPMASATSGTVGTVQYDPTQKRFTLAVMPSGAAASIRLHL